MMRPEIAKRWVEALRSGKFKQGKHRLANETPDGRNYCCLGVLCEIAVEDGVIPPSASVPSPLGNDNSIVYGDVSEVVPPNVVGEWAFEDYDADGLDTWMVVDIDGEFSDHTMVRNGLLHLPEINDVAGADFNQIADLIEATHLGTVNV